MSFKQLVTQSSIHDNCQHSSYTKCRQPMVEYLKMLRPANQLSELGNIISRLIKINRDVSQAEFIVAEYPGLITNYFRNTSRGNLYKVTILPQKFQQ